MSNIEQSEPPENATLPDDQPRSDVQFTNSKSVELWDGAYLIARFPSNEAQWTVERRYVSLDQTLARPRLRSMAPAVELTRRPSRPPDYAAENRALIALAEELATSPHTILQKLADTALDLCRAHSAGLSLLEEGDRKQRFHWRAIAGQWAPHLNGGTPRDFGPCGTVLDRNAALICSHPEIDFPYFGDVRPLA